MQSRDFFAKQTKSLTVCLNFNVISNHTHMLYYSSYNYLFEQQLQFDHIVSSLDYLTPRTF